MRNLINNKSNKSSKETKNLFKIADEFCNKTSQKEEIKMNKNIYTRWTSLAVALIMVFGLALVANASTRGLDVREAEKVEERATAHEHGENCNHGAAESRVERDEDGTITIDMDDKVIIVTDEKEVLIIDETARALTLFKADGRQTTLEISEAEAPLDGAEWHVWRVYTCHHSSPNHMWVKCEECNVTIGTPCNSFADATIMLIKGCFF